MGTSRRGARVLIPYVHTFRDRHGTTRHYYRRGSKRMPLPGQPGSTEFMEAYAAACAAVAAPKAVVKGAPGTIERLVADYEASLEFKRLKPSTATVYRGIYARLVADHGHGLVREMRRQHVDLILARMADKPGAANSFLKRLKTLMAFAIRRGDIAVDPTYKTRGFKAGEIHTWTEEQIAQFEAFWPAGTKQRLAFALHLFTGQRRSDVHRMTWAHYDGAAIRVVQLKTGARLLVPVHPELKELLDATGREQLVIVATEYGKAFSVAGYGGWINDAIRKAGLPDECTAHGLRKAAARRLAEAGCTALEIASITGHRTLAEVERYTRAADQERLSKAAMAKQSANRIGKPSRG